MIIAAAAERTLASLLSNDTQPVAKVTWGKATWGAPAAKVTWGKVTWGSPTAKVTWGAPAAKVTWGAPAAKVTWGKVTWGSPTAKVTWGSPTAKVTWGSPTAKVTWGSPTAKVTWQPSLEGRGRGLPPGADPWLRPRPRRTAAPLCRGLRHERRGCEAPRQRQRPEARRG